MTVCCQHFLSSDNGIEVFFHWNYPIIMKIIRLLSALLILPIHISENRFWNNRRKTKLFRKIFWGLTLCWMGSCTLLCQLYQESGRLRFIHHLTVILSGQICSYFEILRHYPTFWVFLCQQESKHHFSMLSNYDMKLVLNGMMQYIVYYNVLIYF